MINYLCLVDNRLFRKASITDQVITGTILWSVSYLLCVVLLQNYILSWNLQTFATKILITYPL